jgi:hypothetical protein
VLLIRSPLESPSLRDKVSPEIKRNRFSKEGRFRRLDEMKRMERREWMRVGEGEVGSVTQGRVSQEEVGVEGD